jgi:fatty-acyl-CoA synthase
MTYLDKLFRTLAAEPGRIALIDADTGRSVNAAEFTDLIAHLSEALRVCTEASSGDVVAIVAPTTIEGLAVRYAAGLLGCATVYCPDANSADRLAMFLGRIDADLLIVFPETAGCSGVGQQVVSVGAVGNVDIDLLSAAVVKRPLAQAPVQPTDLCVMIATGGTTGASKASRRDWRSYARMVDSAPTSERCQLICTPLAYIAQLLADGALIGGGTVVLHRTFEPARVLQTLQSHRITHLTLVEPLLVELVDCAALASTDLSAASAISHIGADAAASLRARLLDRLGKPVLVNPYGSSEVGAVSALAAPDYSLDHPELLGSSGKPAADVMVRIVGSAERLGRTGEVGTIQVRSTVQAQGYSVAAPSSGFLPDGWFSTGDMGVLDDRGYLHVRGRAADMRVVGGLPVFPVDFQQAFCSLPEVRYAVAVPAPDGEGFGVALVARPGARVDALVDAVCAVSGDHLAPVATVVVDAVPRTEQGKPDRRALTAVLWPGSNTNRSQRATTPRQRA